MSNVPFFPTFEKSIELGKVPNADAIWDYAASRLQAIDAATSR